MPFTPFVAQKLLVYGQELLVCSVLCHDRVTEVRAPLKVGERNKTGPTYWARLI